jgi:hypothetical protein
VEEGPPDQYHLSQVPRSCLRCAPFAIAAATVGACAWTTRTLL